MSRGARNDVRVPVRCHKRGATALRTDEGRNRLTVAATLLVTDRVVSSRLNFINKNQKKLLAREQGPGYDRRGPLRRHGGLSPDRWTRHLGAGAGEGLGQGGRHGPAGRHRGRRRLRRAHGRVRGRPRGDVTGGGGDALGEGRGPPQRALEARRAGFSAPT